MTVTSFETDIYIFARTLSINGPSQSHSHSHIQHYTYRSVTLILKYDLSRDHTRCLAVSCIYIFVCMCVCVCVCMCVCDVFHALQQPPKKDFQSLTNRVYLCVCAHMAFLVLLFFVELNVCFYFYKNIYLCVYILEMSQC